MMVGPWMILPNLCNSIPDLVNDYPHIWPSKGNAYISRSIVASFSHCIRRFIVPQWATIHWKATWWPSCSKPDSLEMMSKASCL